MPTVELDGHEITSWEAFHLASRREFGFPDFYGDNMDAWIDCLSGMRDDDGMSRFTLASDQTLEICVRHAEGMQRRAPHVLQGLQEAVQEVNLRSQEAGQPPLLRLRLA